MKKNGIIILNFGSQYNQLIAKSIRKLGVYVYVLPYNININHIINFNPKGIILSGSPSSVLYKKGFIISKNIFKIGIPILGICYGMQLISYIFQGKIIKGNKAEYGGANFIIKDIYDPLLLDIPNNSCVWMSHFDQVIKVPINFKITGYTKNCIASISCKELNIYGVQFHPEVSQTVYGNNIFKNFIYNICLCKKTWKLNSFIEDSILEIKNKIKNDKVILGFSGGIDSFVTALLLNKAIYKSLFCIFINTGLLLKTNYKKEINYYQNKYNLSIKYIDASKRFISKLKNISNPEKKRKIIGNEFILIFQEEANLISKNIKYLAQGTIYTDIIESFSSLNHDILTIKSHHNVGGLPKNIKFKLIEPIKFLFKDEVRELAKDLNISNDIIYAHPFPGAGLSIRIPGKISIKKLNLLRKADNIFIEELKNHNLYYLINQAFAILLPIKSVGIMGDVRTHEYTIVLRAVNTNDFMTATSSNLPFTLLEKVSHRIINEVKGINRVTYDISSKPPSTIEWE